MAKIPLRAYNREIENLINRGQVDEAVGHCRHILRFFPKHIDTYRLLGKAYLEGQHYAEASDVLQRVLSCVPDDFVSQIGMSIIREDEGNLDAAIWHMERAFEVQPANTAVQGELRRLYGRRDGIEPPKVRLTRGALVRMYARGELYQQAIGEIRAALAEDPKRIDIEVILAQMYFLSGMKVEATEVCSRLISKLPFCFEANRILAEILPETARAEDAKVYQQRVDAMEPYIAYLSKNTPTLADVPDNVVTLDRLEWEASATTAQKPEWARTVGIEWEEQQESLPEWMAMAPEALSGEMPTSEEGTPPALSQSNAAQIEPLQQDAETPAAENKEIPDWMKAAGWGKSTGPEVPPSENAFLEDESAGDEISGGNIPDWLQAMAPQDSTEEGSQPEDQARLDQLSSLLPGNASENLNLDQSGESTQAPAADEEVPSWMKTEASAPEATSIDSAGEEMPDWMKSLGASESPSNETETPDWLKSLGGATEPLTDSGAPADTPVWMKFEAPTSETPAQEPAGEETPDWLKSLAPSPEERAPRASATGEMPDWLKSEETADLEQKIAPQSEIPSESIPVENLEAKTVTPEEQPAPASTPQPIVQPDSENPDETFAWLEALATRQGAAEETLLTKPEDRSETPPDWLQQTGQPETPAPVPEPENEAATGFGEPPAENLESDVPDWLKEFQNDATVQAPTSPELSQSDQSETAVAEPPASELPETSLPVSETPTDEAIPDWLKTAAVETGAAPELNADEQPVEQPNPQEQPSAEAPAPEMAGADADSAFAWLESLAAKQGADEETLLVKPEERLETPPDWVQQEMPESQPESAVAQTLPEVTQPEAQSEPEPAEKEMPDWLASKAEDVETGSVPSESVPDWLKATAEPIEETKADETSGVEIPDWLKSNEPLAEESAVPAAENQPEPSVPTAETPAAGDDAFAWLESLAAKQGADEETLLLKPEDRIEKIPDWVAKQAAEPDQTPEPVKEPEPVMEEPPATAAEEEGTAEEIPDWLKDLEISSEETNAAIDLAFEHPTPTLEENAGVKGEAVNVWMQELPENAAPEEKTFPASSATAGEITHPVPVAAVPVTPTLHQPAPEVAIDVQNVLNRARTALNRGKTQEAVVDYLSLIRRNQALEETVQDLKDALYQHPVDIDLWQTIGDAYAHSNRLQDALDSYTKAEELLR